MIMRVQDSGARHYYLQEAAQEGGAVRQLERNIESHYYQRLLTSQGGNMPQTIVNAQLQPIDEKSFVKASRHLEVRNHDNRNIFSPFHKKNVILHSLTRVK